MRLQQDIQTHSTVEKGHNKIIRQMIKATLQKNK